MSLRHSAPLVGVHTDAVHARITRRFDNGAITGLAASAKDHICTLRNRLFCGGGAPLRIGEGDIQTTGVIGGQELDVRVDVQSAGFIAFLEAHHRGNQIRAQHCGDGARLGQLGSQRAR